MPPTSATPPEQPAGDPRGVSGGSSTGRRRAFVLIVVVLAIAGAVAGFVWARLVPDVEFVMTQIGPMPGSEIDAGELASMDSWYGVLGGGVGLVLGAVLATVFLRYGAVTVVALAVGGCLAAVAAFVVGSVVANGGVVLTWQPKAPLDTRLTSPLTLHAYGFLLVWPIAVLAPVVPVAWFGGTEGAAHERAVGPGDSVGS